MARPDGRPTTVAATRQLVTIEQVDLPNLLCHVRDKQGASHGVTFRNSGPLQEIPKTGQMWVAERMSSTEWHLKERRESADEITNRQTMHPGETLLRGGSRLQISSDEIDIDLTGNADALIQIPGTAQLEVGALTSRAFGSSSSALPMGAMFWEKKTTSGSTTSWTLSHNPVGIKTVQLFDNASLVDPSGLGLTTNVLTFPSIATGHVLIVYYQTLVA